VNYHFPLSISIYFSSMKVTDSSSLSTHVTLLHLLYSFLSIYFQLFLIYEGTISSSVRTARKYNFTDKLSLLVSKTMFRWPTSEYSTFKYLKKQILFFYIRHKKLFFKIFFSKIIFQKFSMEPKPLPPNPSPIPLGTNPNPNR